MFKLKTNICNPASIEWKKVSTLSVDQSDYAERSNVHLKLMYSNETNETSFFLHLDTVRQNIGSKLWEGLCNILSLGFMSSSLITWPAGLLLYSRSKDNITGYGEDRSWLSICNDSIWNESFCWSKLCTRSAVMFFAHMKSNSCKRNIRWTMVHKALWAQSIDRNPPTWGCILIKEIPISWIKNENLSI